VSQRIPNVNTKSTETLEGALGNLSTAHSSLEKLVTEDLWKRDRPLDESNRVPQVEASNPTVEEPNITVFVVKKGSRFYKSGFPHIVL
jgi:hypothetical protein